jgi:uncharacterized protein involved in outer membrane biogenesis
MSFRISRKTLVLTLVGMLVFYLVFGWLALPRIIQSQAEKYIAEKTGHHLTLDRPEFNPLDLDLRLANLRLEEPDGKPLFAFRELDVDFSFSSLFRRALVFDAIRLDGAEATVVLRRDGKLNWSALVDALKNKNGPSAPTESNAPLPRLDIRQFVLSDGRLNFTDDKTAFSTRFEPLALELSDISTLPDNQGSYKIEAHTMYGAHLLWEGRMTLAPVAVTGKLGIEGVDLTKLAPYLKDVLPLEPPAGVLALATDYRITYDANRFDLTLDNATAKVHDLRLSAKNGGPAIAIDTIEAGKGHYDLGNNRIALGTLTVNGSEITLPHSGAEPLKLLRLGELAFNDVRADLAKHDLALARVALKDGELQAVRDAHGHLDVVEALQAVLPAAPAAPTKPEVQPGSKAIPWHYRVDKFELAGFSAALRDEGVTPAADFMLQDITLGVDGISDDLAKPLPVEAALRSRDGGNLEVSGKVVPSEPSADLQLKLAGLALKPAQPYLTSFAKLTLTGGELSAEGRASYGKHGGKFKGGFTVRKLRLVETETNDTFLAWKSLGSRDLEASQTALDIGELAVDGLESKLIINKDKSLNVTDILRKTEPAANAAPNAAPPATPPTPAEAEKKEPAFLVNIDRVKISNGAMNFADYSLILPFGTSIHDLHGSLNGLSSRPGTPGQIELDGQVDEYGIARALGQIDLFDPTGYTDIKVMFHNVEMTRLTPYSATFAGRKIKSGKLSLDLEYKINKRQLEGDNQIVMDKLTLGEHVESPGATNLPLDLAIAILQDADGRIDLGLPVSGSLDDPQFSYGSIIWKAIVNVIGKIATAPFRALGALFGGGEKFENIAFEMGAPQLSPPEREKLVRLAGALNKRPGLALTVHGVYTDADRGALQDLQLRRAVAKLAGQHVEEQEDPGPLSTHSPKVQAALEKLYAKRVGAAELDTLKEGFRKANPGQMEESIGGKMLSRLSGLFREKRKLDEHEVEQLKGADFYAVLFQRLRDHEIVTDAQLQALAKTRGENTMAALQIAGAPPERLQLAAPEKVDGAEHDVPLKLELGPAPKPAAAAPN